MIPIRNVYHMLAYAFQKLKGGEYRRCSSEHFHNVSGLLAEILIRGLNTLVKQGLSRNYSLMTECTSNIRGKLDISASIKTQAFHKKELVCDFDIFDEGFYPNRIIKTTLQLLLKHNIEAQQKQQLRKLLFYFQNVSELSLDIINWRIQYDRNNQHYKMLMYICQMILKGMIQNHEDGKMKLLQFIDDANMCHLYEKFILNYYRKEHPELRTSSEQIPWALTSDKGCLFQLPTLQTDVIVRRGKNTLIIDAKFYNANLCSKYGGRAKLHSNNVNQIYVYVDNYRKLHPDENVYGLLLYAKTDAVVQPNASHDMFAARTLDLNAAFDDIAKQLDSIVELYLSTTS